MSKYLNQFILSLLALPALPAIDQCPGARPITPGVPHRNAARIGTGVMPGNGSFHYVQEDLATSGRVMGLRLRRVYRSDMGYHGPIGYGWTGEYFQAAVVLPDTGDIRWYDQNGHVHNFVDKGGYFVAPPGVYVTAQASEGAVTLTSADGTVLAFTDFGRLAGITDRDGNTVVLDYDADCRLTRVTDDRGEYWDFEYDADGRIVRLIDHVWETETRPARTVEFSYDGSGLLVELRLPETERYSDAGNNRATWRYSYSATGALTEIRSPNQVAAGDPAGTEILYDADERVVAFRDRHPTAWHYVRYTSSGVVRHIDPRGVRTDYTLDDGHAVGVEVFTGFWQVDSNEPIEHDEVNQVAPKLRASDPDSYVTTHAFSKGHELVETLHPAGNRDAYHYSDPTKLAREKADAVSGSVITVNGAGWTPGDFAGGFVRMGVDKSSYAYCEVADNTDETITVVGVDLAAQGWGAGDRFVVWSENPDPLAAGNLLEHRQVSGSEMLVRAWTYEAFFQQVRSETSPTGHVTEYVYNYELTGDPGAPLGGTLVTKRHPSVTVLAPDGSTSSVNLETHFSYNSFGQLETTTDPEGHTELRHYYSSGDQRGFLEEIITAWCELDLTQRFEYDKTGLLTGQWPPEAFAAGATPDDFRTSWQVNALGRRWHEAGPVVHDGSGERIDTYRYFDPDGNEVTTWREYVAGDGAAPGAPGYVHDPGTFSKSATPMTETWAETARCFDLAGRLLSETEDEEAGAPVETITRSIEYDELGRVILETSPAGNQTAYTYDERGLLLQRTEGDGSVVAGDFEYDYTLNGELAAERTPLGYQTAHDHDGFGRRVKTTDPAGHYREVDYDNDGTVIAERCYDADSVLLTETRREFDEAGRLLKVRRLAQDAHGDPIGSGWAETWYTLDGRGLATGETSGGRTWSFSYDAAGRRISERDPVGNLVVFTLDESGNVTRADFSDFNTHTSGIEPGAWQADYDRLGNVLRVRDRRHRPGLDTEVRHDYDSWSRRVRSIDAQGVVTLRDYDLQSRPTRETENPDGLQFEGESAPEWDKEGRLKFNRVPENPDGTVVQTTEWIYDARGRVVSIVRPDGVTRTLAWDADSNLVAWTEFSGASITQTFDPRGHVLTRAITHGSGESGATGESFSYDGAGRMASSATTEGGVVTCQSAWTWNTLGGAETLTRSLRTPDGDLLGSWTGTAAFNEHGEVSETGYSNGTISAVTCDNLGRITSVSVDSFPGTFSAIEWAGADRIAHRTHANGTHTEYDYEPGFAGPVQRIAHARGGQVLFAVERRFDVRALPVRERREHEGASGRVQQFDPLRRLQVATLGADLHGSAIDDPLPPTDFGHALEVNHQLPGNRSSVTWTDQDAALIRSESYSVSGDKLNRYGGAGGFGFSYDAGARVSWDESAGVYYRYDYRGLLLTVDDASDFSSPERVYRYDAQGRRVYEEEHENGVLLTRTAILHGAGDSDAPLEEHVFDGAFVQQSTVRYLYGPADEIVGACVDGAWSWRHSDVDGSLLGLTGSGGRRTVEFDYQPFGAPVRREIRADLSNSDLVTLEPGVPTPDALRIHVAMPPFVPGEFAGRELAISLPGLASGDRYRTTEVLGNGASYIDAWDPAGEILEALDELGAGFVVYVSRLALSDGSPPVWEYDELTDVSTFHVSGAGFTSWLNGGWLTPDTDHLAQLEIIDVDPLGDWVSVRGNALGVSSAGHHWRALPPVGVDPDAGYTTRLAERYLYRGMRHDAAARVAPAGLNRRGLYGPRGFDPRTGRYSTPGEPGEHPYAFHPWREPSAPNAVPAHR